MQAIKNKINIKEYLELYQKIVSTRRTLFTILISLIYAVVEVLTIGVTALFVQIISSNNNLEGLKNSKIILNTLPLLIQYISIHNFFIFFLFLIVIRYIYSLLYFNEIYNIIFNISSRLNKLTSETIFKQKYEELKNENFQNTKNIFYKEIDYYITYFIQPLLLLIPDVFQIIFLIIFLILFLPHTSIIIIVILILMVYYINKFAKSRVVLISEGLTIHQRRRTLILGNYYSNILYWRVKNLQNLMNNYFSKENEIISNSYSKLNFYQQIPRTTFEFLIYFIFCIFSLLNINSTNQIFFSYVIMSLAAIKLLPSAVKLSSFIQSALSAKMIVQNFNSIFIKEESLTNMPEIDLIEFNDKIELKNGCFNYKNHLIIDNCNFTFNKNDIISISGSSGSGKTTLIEILMRQLDLTKGQLLFDGDDISKRNVNFSKIIGIVPQTIQFNNDSLKANLLFGINDDVTDLHLNEILEKCNLTHFIKNLPAGLDTIIDNNSNAFSGGERQRIAIARCLLDKNVKILIFDEITSALDEVNATNLLNSIMSFKHEYSIIFITHNNIVRNYCNKNYEFKNKKLESI